MSDASDYPDYNPTNTLSPPSFAPPPTNPLTPPSLQQDHKSQGTMTGALVMVFAIMVLGILCYVASRVCNKQTSNDEDDDSEGEESEGDVKKVQVVKSKNPKKSRVHEEDFVDLESGVDEGCTSAEDEAMRNGKFEKERFARDVEKSKGLSIESESDCDERCSDLEDGEYYDAEESVKNNAFGMESRLYYKKFSKSKKKGSRERKR